MLGPVSGVASAARRRARYRRRLVIVAALVVVFVFAELVHQIVNASSPAARRTAGSWVANLAPTITDANLLSSTFAYVESKGSTMSRPKLTLIMHGLRASSSTQLENVRTNTLGAPSLSAKELLVSALNLRARSFAGFDVAVHSVISGGTVTSAYASFELWSSLMQNAQSRYRLFIRALPKGSAPTQLPGVDWFSSSGALAPAELLHFASSLSKAPQLRAHRALTITAISLNPLPEVVPTTTTTTTTTTTIPKKAKSSTTKKAPVVKRKRSTTTTTLPELSQIPSGNTPSVFAPTSSLRPIIVVKNQGNITESDVVVEVLMNNETVQSAPLAPLVPGASRYLELSSLRVMTSTMAKCSSPALRHDRCTQIEVLVKTSASLVAHRSVALAFFVS